MPCRDYREEQESYEVRDLEKRLDYYARMLCTVLEQAEKERIIGKLFPANLERTDEVWNWWREHKKSDALSKF